MDKPVSPPSGNGRTPELPTQELKAEYLSRPDQRLRSGPMARASGGTRRRLTTEQQREIAELYSETGTPTAEIRERFGIGESSLYRVLQKQHVSLRGRVTSPVNGPANGGLVTATGKRSRGRPRRGASVQSQVRVRGASKSTATEDGAALQFRVRFEGQRIFDARNLRDALRQAEALGATDIIEITRLA